MGDQPPCTDTRRPHGADQVKSLKWLTSYRGRRRGVDGGSNQEPTLRFRMLSPAPDGSVVEVGTQARLPIVRSCIQIVKSLVVRPEMRMYNVVRTSRLQPQPASDRVPLRQAAAGSFPAQRHRTTEGLAKGSPWPQRRNLGTNTHGAASLRSWSKSAYRQTCCSRSSQVN